MSRSREARLRRKALIAKAEAAGREAAETCISRAELAERVRAACAPWPTDLGDVVGECHNSAQRAARFGADGNYSLWGRTDQEREDEAERAAKAAVRQAIADVLATATQWLRMPTRWRAARVQFGEETRIAEFVGPRQLRRSLARVIVAAAAHAALRDKSIRLDHHSASGSIYLRRGDVRLRISDHDLGFADYGSREQRHDGPEVIVAGVETPEEVAASIAAAWQETCEEAV